MKKYLVVVSSENNKITKYLDFSNKSEADSFSAARSGSFVVDTPSGNMKYWVVNSSEKTVTFDKSASDAASLGTKWKSLRETRNRLLAQSDNLGLSDVTMSTAWKTYRQALRDLPANTSDPGNVTWPSAP